MQSISEERFEQWEKIELKEKRMGRVASTQTIVGLHLSLPVTEREQLSCLALRQRWVHVQTDHSKWSPSQSACHVMMVANDIYVNEMYLIRRHLAAIVTDDLAYATKLHSMAEYQAG